VKYTKGWSESVCSPIYQVTREIVLFSDFIIISMRTKSGKMGTGGCSLTTRCVYDPIIQRIPGDGIEVESRGKRGDCDERRSDRDNEE